MDFFDFAIAFLNYIREKIAANKNEAAIDNTDSLEKTNFRISINPEMFDPDGSIKFVMVDPQNKISPRNFMITNPLFSAKKLGVEVSTDKSDKNLFKDFVQNTLILVVMIGNYGLKKAQGRRNKLVDRGELDNGQPYSAIQTSANMDFDQDEDSPAISLIVKEGMAKDLPIEEAVAIVEETSQDLVQGWAQGKMADKIRRPMNSSRAEKYYEFMSQLLVIGGAELLEEVLPEFQKLPSGKMSLVVTKKQADRIIQIGGYNDGFRTR